MTEKPKPIAEALREEIDAQRLSVDAIAAAAGTLPRDASAITAGRLRDLMTAYRGSCDRLESLAKRVEGMVEKPGRSALYAIYLRGWKHGRRNLDPDPAAGLRHVAETYPEVAALFTGEDDDA